ncbi:hypothetical protein LPW11_01800 [Geomonas sp. RF6]|uniref:hypothetical protein n=1 Tax=Geomonas sp. RF6 TaxID=2897342 RepID=UPI001E3BF26B|nr:hypothetical protein [Geomonas sp. RF6]UFS70930.1 hypothetical protein LPW11_01800 [Geomonas sp. RF6]
MSGKYSIVRWCGFLLLSTLLVFAAAGGVIADPGGEQALLAKYPALQSKLEKSYLGAPIYLESAEAGDSLRVDMYGVFHHPFSALRDALQSPSNWCDITSLHINIKACTYRKSGDQWYLTLYSGRKYYQPASDAYPLRLKFQAPSQEPNYLQLLLSADEGPLHTKNHRMRLEAAPLPEGHSFVHFSYTYGYGSMTRMAMKSYFATIGRDKVGFSLAGGGKGFVGGVRGAIERNAVRYYLAVQSYLDTLSFPEGQRFEQRTSRWYDLTVRYPRQLKEMDKPDYLAMKRQEQANQLALQKKEGTARPLP